MLEIAFGTLAFLVSVAGIAQCFWIGHRRKYWALFIPAAIIGPALVAGFFKVAFPDSKLLESLCGILIVVTVAVFLPCYIAHRASNEGRRGRMWFIASLFFSPILVAAILQVVEIRNAKSAMRSQA